MGQCRMIWLTRPKGASKRRQEGAQGPSGAAWRQLIPGHTFLDKLTNCWMIVFAMDPTITTAHAVRTRTG